MPPRNSLTALPHILSILFLPPTILLFWNFALITTLLSSLVLLFRVLRVYLDVGVAILAERWRSPPGRVHHVHGSVGGGKEGWGNESTSRLEWRRRSGSGSGVSLREEREVEDMDMVLPVGRVNYATLIRPLEPASEWRARRAGASGGGYLDLDLDLDLGLGGGEVREVEEGWSWNGWEEVASR